MFRRMLILVLASWITVLAYRRRDGNPARESNHAEKSNWRDKASRLGEKQILDNFLLALSSSCQATHGIRPVTLPRQQLGSAWHRDDHRISGNHGWKSRHGPVKMDGGIPRMDSYMIEWEENQNNIRDLFSVFFSVKEELELDRKARMQTRESGDEDTAKQAFVGATAAVVIAALVIQFGGRAAIVSFVGLDVIASLGISDQIDKIVQFADDAGGFAVVAFLISYALSKILLLSPVTGALACSAGLLFGGVLQGALLSMTGNVIGGLAAFGLSRSVLQQRVEKFVDEQPIARALAKVAEEDTFKTVFSLRVAPIIPGIPLGAYPYIYGLSKMNPLIFAPAIFLGSAKVCLLDSYIGIFSKEAMDGKMDGSQDVVLLVGVGALVLVGIFVTQLAEEIFDTIQAEVDADGLRRKDAASRDADEAKAKVSNDENNGGFSFLGQEFNDGVLIWLLSKLSSTDARDDALDIKNRAQKFINDQVKPVISEVALSKELKKKWEANEFTGRINNEESDALFPGEASQFQFRQDSLRDMESPPTVPWPSTAAELEARRELAEWSATNSLASKLFMGWFLLSGSLSKVFDTWNNYPDEEEKQTMKKELLTLALAAIRGSRE